MTFTKEKLQQLENAIYDTIHGMNMGNPSPRDVDLVVQAAEALPKYIAALDTAEEALLAVKEDYDTNLASDELNFMEYRKVCAALTTIRKMKGE
jgi:hypothetical protein